MQTSYGRTLQPGAHFHYHSLRYQPVLSSAFIQKIKCPLKFSCWVVFYRLSWYIASTKFFPVIHLCYAAWAGNTVDLCKKHVLLHCEWHNGANIWQRWTRGKWRVLQPASCLNKTNNTLEYLALSAQEFTIIWVIIGAAVGDL